MIRRALPLAACLLWLAFEAQFSPRVFMDNVRNSVAEIKGNLDGALNTQLGRTTKVADSAPSD